MKILLRLSDGDLVIAELEYAYHTLWILLISFFLSIIGMFYVRVLVSGDFKRLLSCTLLGIKRNNHWIVLHSFSVYLCDNARTAPPAYHTLPAGPLMYTPSEVYLDPTIDPVISQRAEDAVKLFKPFAMDRARRWIEECVGKIQLEPSAAGGVWMPERFHEDGMELKW